MGTGWVAAEGDRGFLVQTPTQAGTGQCPARATVGVMTRPLRIAGCRSRCGWQDTGDRLADQPLFACSGCGSEWVPSEPWTPIDYEGAVPEPVAEARRTRGRG